MSSNPNLNNTADSDDNYSDQVRLELEEIQSLVLFGHAAELPAARYLMLRFSEKSQLTQWLKKLEPEITTAEKDQPQNLLNLAFTQTGMHHFGLADVTLESFSLEFKEGMATEHRQRILGDVHGSCPDHWSWGAGNQQVHAVMIIFSQDKKALENKCAEQVSLLNEMQVDLVTVIEGTALPGEKEHFGFRDGIAQPRVLGFDGDGTGNTIHPGEFILGYLNEYGRYTQEPLVDLTDEQGECLPLAEDGPGYRSFGKNGSYLVFRQLEQDVSAFWQCLADATDSDEDMIRMAAKMVGRWPNGAPLVLNDQQEPDESHPMFSQENGLDKFNYFDQDPYGQKCPMGSHIRRTNPRDALMPDPGTKVSDDTVKHHRILRRGRPYGDPLDEVLDPTKMIGRKKEGERGLLFLCVNANISRQFEFIQHTWINNKKFAGLYNDADPIMGNHDPKGRGEFGSFAVPQEPTRRKMDGLDRFVSVKGGAYFFLPSKRAIHYLCLRSSNGA